MQETIRLQGWIGSHANVKATKPDSRFCRAHPVDVAILKDRFGKTSPRYAQHGAGDAFSCCHVVREKHLQHRIKRSHQSVRRPIPSGLCANSMKRLNALCDYHHRSLTSDRRILNERERSHASDYLRFFVNHVMWVPLRNLSVFSFGQGNIFLSLANGYVSHVVLEAR